MKVDTEDIKPVFCVLFGFKEISHDSLNVNLLATKSFYDPSGRDKLAIQQLIKHRHSLSALGTLETSKIKAIQRLIETKKTFFVDFNFDGSLYVKNIHLNGKPDTNIPVNIIVYNSLHLVYSLQFNGHNELTESKDPLFEFCCRSIEKYSSQKAATSLQLTSFATKLSSNSKATGIDTKKIFNFSLLDGFLDYSTTGRLIYHRLQEILFCWKNFKESRFRIRIFNALSLITFDLVLSLCLFLMLNQVISISYLLEVCLQAMESVVSKVEQLIYNLIGMPAGLKLNRPLNTALGNFFLYHIHIWKAYITLIRPFLSLILDLLGFISFFGITFVLSFLSDLISLASIHIYCFYGYAARLYCFQLSGLISLWRLFRGKKWNSLKHRVDAYSYGHDQLFIGTVCFTILIFLLPTILLYYSVFLFLRLITIVIQCIIKLIISVTLSIPFYGILLWFIGSQQVQTNIFFQITHFKERLLIISMSFKSMTLNQLFEAHTHDFDNPFSYN